MESYDAEWRDTDTLNDLWPTLTRLRPEAVQALLTAASIAPQSDNQPQADHSTRLKEGGAFVFDEPDQIPALWGRGNDVLWAEGEGLLIYADQGLGKTTIAQRLVLHLTGIETGPLLGLPVRRLPIGRKILYLAMDRPRQAARSLRRMVEPESRAILDQFVTVWKGPMVVNPLRDARAMADWVQEICPEVAVVIIDSVKDLAPGIADDKVGAGLNSAWQELVARGIDIVSLHHGRKAKQGESRRMRLDEIYGSVWLTSGQGSVIGLDGEQGREIIEFFHLKQPAETVGPLTVRFDRAQGTVELVEAAKTLQQLMIEAGDIGITIAEAARVTYGDSLAKNQQRVRRTFKSLLDRELVVKHDGENTNEGKQPDRYVLSKQVRWAVEQGHTTSDDIFNDNQKEQE